MLPRFDHATNPAVMAVTRWIAQHSYGIYLTHMSVMWISFVGLATLPAPLRWLIFVFLSVMTPIACLQLVENPMIKLGKKLTHPAQESVRSAAA
jgi:peptidoglycan/LPS O-acetylase OafA/YrhL